MKKINLFDMNHNKIQVDLVRFFQYNHDKYFIYTLNEEDQQGYVKLYLVKVLEDFGRCISYHISDQEEWQNTQNLLKTMLSELKYNKPKSFKDLNPDKLNGIYIEKTRIFKFQKNLVDLLSKTQDIITESTKENSVPNNLKESEQTYQKKYEAAEQEIQRLNQVMGNLLAENIRYQTKYGKLD